MYSKLSVIICLSSLPFLFTLKGDFVFDDTEAIVKNKDVSDSWTDMFYNDFWGTNINSNLSHKSYRPLTVLSFRLNYILNRRKLSSVQFKVINLVCHVICCVLLWNVFEHIFHGKKANKKCEMNKKYTPPNTLSQKWWMDVPYLSTLLFAVHPIHVEAVCGIVGRADLLASMMFFLAFLSYNKAIVSPYWRNRHLLYAVIFSAMSMLCKENGITVLGFCVLYEIVLKLKYKKSVSTKKKVINSGLVCMRADSIIRIFLITFAAMGLLYARWLIMGAITPEFKPTDNPTAFAENLFTKVATYNYIYLVNILLLIWPKWLCYDWSMGCIQLIKSYTDYRLIPICLMYLYGLLMIRAIYRSKKRKSRRALILGASLGVIPFLPASNIFYPVGFVIAERVLYISSAGYCLLVVMGFSKLLRRRSLFKCKILVFMFLLLLLLYAVRTWLRSIAWQNEYNLFISALAVCPLNAKVHYNVAKVADAKQDTTLALSEYKEAIRLFPEYYQAMNNLANILKNQKQYSEAECFLQSAVGHKQDFPAAWMNLGIVLAQTAQYDESELAYKTALSYRKKYPDCHYNLGNLYLELNETEAALNSWFKAISQNSKHVMAWTNVLALMDNTDQIERALNLVPKVLTELPDAPSINFAVANIYGKLNRYDEAESHFKKAIKLLDKEVQALHYANLGVLYHRWRKYDLAKQMYTNALKIDSSFHTARKNLEKLKRSNKLSH